MRVRHTSTRHSHLINAIRQPTSKVSYALTSRLTTAHLPPDKDGLHYKSIRKLSWRKFKGIHTTRKGLMIDFRFTTFSIWASLRTNQFLNFELRVRHPSTRQSHLINVIRRTTSEVSYALSSRLTIAHLPSDKDGLHYKSIRQLSWRKFKGIHTTQQGIDDRFQIHWAIWYQTIQLWRFSWMHWQDFQELRLIWHDSQVPYNVFTWRRRNLHSWQLRQLTRNLEPNKARRFSEQSQHDLGGQYLYWRYS